MSRSVVNVEDEIVPLVEIGARNECRTIATRATTSFITSRDDELENPMERDSSRLTEPVPIDDNPIIPVDDASTPSGDVRGCDSPKSYDIEAQDSSTDSISELLDSTGVPMRCGPKGRIAALVAGNILGIFIGGFGLFLTTLEFDHLPVETWHVMKTNLKVLAGIIFALSEACLAGSFRLTVACCRKRDNP